MVIIAFHITNLVTILGKAQVLEDNPSSLDYSQDFTYCIMAFIIDTYRVLHMEVFQIVKSLVNPASLMDSSHIHSFQSYKDFTNSPSLNYITYLDVLACFLLTDDYLCSDWYSFFLEKNSFIHLSCLHYQSPQFHFFSCVSFPYL